MSSPGPDPDPAAPVPVAVLARTSTLYLQDPLASLQRQYRSCEEWLPEGWYVAGFYWDVESGAIDLEDRSQTDSHQQFTAAGLPRDGGMADLLEEAAAPDPRFAAVVCEDIERSGRDTFNALKLERELSDKGMPLFATDEPASTQDISPTTVLVRRVKQGVAEYLRLQIKKKAWDGLRQHALAGWNIGAAPYGYQAEKVTHPAPIKAAQGRTKTRLKLDPLRGPVVGQIYTWRVEQHLGVPAITARLNAGQEAFPPPGGRYWLPSTVAAILANPKYTGHMVYGRRRKTGRGGKLKMTPPDQWIWTEHTVHPAIITRDMYDAAQAIANAHRSSGDAPGASPQPLARRSYPLRGRVRCRTCQRRMCGTTRTSPRYWAEGPDYTHTYYKCPLDVNNPRHAAAHPDHPRTITIRQDTLLAIIRDGLAQHVFGPDRAALLRKQIPASRAQAAGQRARQRDRLAKELARIELAQKSQITQIEALDPASTAAQAMRARCYERFAELQAERETTQNQLDALDHAPACDDDTSLLDLIPLLADTLDLHSERVQAGLYQAFDIQALYDNDMHQVTIEATITTSTPQAVAAPCQRHQRRPRQHPAPP
ncbi:MAG TPA: recombinase family protein [Streptosporangiaceae bacterium]|jgi:DNA invertase Pin-like site-specific DNA recombinase